MSKPEQAAKEWQFDGLVGPTHNYAGLSFGNIASEKNAGQASNPKAAALQGLEKMRLVNDLGVPQAFLPPQKRPFISLLQRLGFGSGHSRAAIAKTIDNTYENAPHLLAAAYSSSFMWTANTATISPSGDTRDKKLHITPANLCSHLHRSIEAEQNYRLLQRIFHNESLFDVHNPLPATVKMADEGAANCMRVCSSHGDRGVEIFVYGAAEHNINKPKIYPARQHLESCQAITRMHQVSDNHIIYVQQHPDVIDQGVFHNDVIAMNTTRLMIAHERAFLSQNDFITKLEQLEIPNFKFIEIAEKELSVADAVASYFFNSELLELPDGRFTILAPGECETNLHTHRLFSRLVEEDKVVSTVQYLNVRESMRNGGGPACLRLRVVMTPEESAAMHQGIVITKDRHAALIQWVNRHYRDRLSPDDLRDPGLIDELDAAYEALERLVGMEGLYSC